MDKFSNIQTQFTQIEDGLLSDYDVIHFLVLDCLFVQHIVDSSNMFSINENLDDYITSHIMYLAIPYYLGELYLRLKTNNSEERLNNVIKSKVLLNSFIENGIRLGLISNDEKVSVESENLDAETKRNDKILRYRRETEIQDKLKSLIETRRNNFNLTPDEEFEREVSTLVVRSCLLKSINSISTLKQEEELLKFFAEMQKEGKKIEPPPEDKDRPFQKPIVIRSKKQEIKEKALLPGYNQPTLSVEQAGEIDLQECLEREQRQKEIKENNIVQEFEEDEYTKNERELNQKREFDDWLDEHPKGSGNTGTKGYYYG